MEKKYKLMSGEEIDLKTLRKHEIKHIESLEECINDRSNHDKTDYLYVYKKAFEPIPARGSRIQLERLFDSSFYKVVKDIVTKYHHKYVSKENKKD